MTLHPNSGDCTTPAAKDVPPGRNAGPEPDQAVSWDRRARVILESIGDAVLTTDALGKVEYMNPMAEALTGWPLSEARYRPVEEVFRIVHEETGQPVESPVDRVLREGVVVGLANHTVLMARDGRQVPISDGGAPIRQPDGQLSGVVLVFRDQTAERTWQRHREAERDLLEMHARGLPLETWLEQLCRSYEKLHPGALCTVLFVQNERLYTAAAPSLPPSYCQAISGIHIGPCVGSCGTSAWRKERVIVTDIAHDPLWKGYEALAAAHQLAACWSFPIFDAFGEVLGTFAVYYRTPRGPTPEEVRTLERWAHLTSLVIQHHRTAQELRRSEARLAEAQARAHLGSWELDLTTGHGEWSAEMARLHHWPVDRSAPSFSEFLALVHPEDQHRIRAIHQRLGQVRAPFIIEYRTHPDRGPIRHVQARLEVIRNEAGQPVRVAGTSLDITDRVRLEAQVRHSEEQFRRLIQFAPEAIVLLDVASGRFVLVNAAAERLFQMPARELLRHGPADLSPPLQPDGQPSARKVHQYIAAALAGETPVFEWIHRDARGREIPCEVRLLRLEFDGRTVIRGSLLDISERKAAEQNIQRLARAHKLRSEVSQLLLQGRDQPEALMESLCRLLVETGEVRAAVAARRGPPEAPCEVVAMAVPAGWDRHAVAEVCAAALSGQWPAVEPIHAPGLTSAPTPVSATVPPEWLERLGVRSVAWFLIGRDGPQQWFLLGFSDRLGYFDLPTTQLFNDLASKLALALESHQKERDRREALERLRQSEERFRLLIENASDLISVLDRHGVIHYQSPSVTHVLGYEPAFLHGRSVLEFVHPDDQARVLAALQQVVTTRESTPVTVNLRIRHHDGSWHHLEAVGRYVPSLLPGGGVVVNSRDISEVRHLQEQLRQAQKLEAIGRLAGGVAHDFNNILSVLMMQTELIRMTDSLPPAVLDGLDQIHAAAERAAALTRQLLLFSRKQVMQPRELDLNDVVTTLIKMIQRIIGEDIQLQLRLHPEPLLMRADPGMLDQILMNLVVNARDAMPQGGLLILETDCRTVGAGSSGTPADLGPGRYAVLRVADTGVGIPPEHLDRIFEPFFTTKEPGKGTGLGLSTVFGASKQHGGTVTVSSTVGHGTTFEVWLPLLDKTTLSQHERAPAHPPGGTETILLVEDDESVRNLTRAILESAGYRVLAAAHGHEALSLWSAHAQEVQLLFTDLVMPGGLGGRDLAQQLLKEKPDLRVIFTTGYSAEIAGREWEVRPGQAFLPKPANPVEILRTVRCCLDGRPGPNA